MESGCGEVYDPSLPRTDIFWAKNEQGVYHADLIKHKPYGYKDRRGWFCVYCKVTFQGHNYKHVCTAQNIKNCFACNRILMTPGRTYLNIS